MEEMELGDGRSLGFLIEGSDHAIPLVVHHGALTALAGYAGVGSDFRLIMPIRAGYGTSTRQPGRKVASIAADVEALLDHLGVAEFATLGVAGGGPHALACAALLHRRCSAAATIASLAPLPADGLDWFDGFIGAGLAEFMAAAAGEEALTAFMHTTSLLTLSATGWRDDDLALAHDWGFDPADIRAPVALWHGEGDRTIPAAHSRWLSHYIPGAELHILHDEGHLSLLGKLPDIAYALVQASSFFGRFS